MKTRVSMRSPCRAPCRRIARMLGVAGDPDLPVADEPVQVGSREPDIERLVDEAETVEAGAREILDLLDAVAFVRAGVTSSG